MTRELSSYAFTTYGSDANLYNAIHDMETRIESAEQALAYIAEFSTHDGDVAISKRYLTQISQWERDILRGQAKKEASRG